MRIKELNQKIAFIRLHVSRFSEGIERCLEMCKNRWGGEESEAKLAELTARLDSMLAVLDQVERDHSRPRSLWERIVRGGRAEKGTGSLIYELHSKLAMIGVELLDQTNLLRRLPWRSNPIG